MSKIKDIYEDYKPNLSIFADEPEKIRRVKKIIFYKLSEPDRNIILMYAELQSIRKLSKALNVSAASAWLKIDEIRSKIRSLMGEQIK